jgi:hypothetical protein
MGLELEGKVDQVHEQEDLSIALAGHHVGSYNHNTYHAGAVTDNERVLLCQLFVSERPVEHRLAIHD